MTSTNFVLYHGLASTCSKKVRLTLYEKGLSFESRLMNLQKFDQHQPEYLELNPSGVVPTLVDDGNPITESSIIMEYIDDCFPDAVPLTPTDPALRAKMRLWLKFSENVGFDAIFLPTWAVLSVKTAKSLDAEALNEVISRIPTAERRDRWKKIAGEGFAESEFEEAIAKMINCLDKLEEGLSSGPWLAGEQLSLADLANIPYVERIHTLHPEMFEEATYPNLMDWEKRMRARPSFDKAFNFTDDPRVGEMAKL